MKLGMISLGCAKNLVDSERVLGLAKSYQFEITNKMPEADVIVVNTCGFIESAKKKRWMPFLMRFSIRKTMQK